MPPVRPPPVASNGRAALHLKAKELPERPVRVRELFDDLLERPNAAHLIQALPEQTVYLAIREIGLADSLEILRLCSPEQVRACLDIDCWQRDELRSDKMLEWLIALAELGPEPLARVVARLDHELLTTFLRPLVRVYETSAEDSHEEPEGRLYQTPDTFYVVDVLAEGGSGQAIERVIESLYMADLDLGRRIMMGAKWDIGAETEEAAYRFRSARMADLGYIEYYEALDVYKYLDPHSVELTEGTAPPLPDEGDPTGTGLLPPEVAGPFLEEGPLGLAMTQLSPREREHLLTHLMYLSNKVMSADRVDPGDTKAADASMRRTAGYLSLGIEYLSQQDPMRAPTALRNVALSRLFRVGYSLTAQLAALSRLLVEKGLVTLVPHSEPASLLDPPHSEVVRLLSAHPLYCRLLDGKGEPGERPFSRLLEVARTAQILEQVKQMGEFLTLGLGLRTETLDAVLKEAAPRAGQVRLSDLLGTMVANLLLQRPPSLVPLARADLPALRQAALGLQTSPASGFSAAARKTVHDVLRGRVRERSLNQQEDASLWSASAQRLLDQTIERLGQSLSQLPQELSQEQADAVPVVPGLVLR